MAYTISNTDGTTLVTLGDRTIDRTTTSLTLVGKNYTGYGEHINNNFVKLLASSASSSSSPPRNPLKGQLWYDTTAQRLKIYDDNFKSVSGAIISGDQPTNIITGDLWFDTTNEQLKVASGGQIYTVGPVFPKFVGENGWVLPYFILKDIDETSKNVTLIKNFGQTLGFIAGDEFVISTGTQFSYITTATTSTVRGLNILGDIQATGMVIIGSDPPPTRNSTGTVGTITWDTSSVYICYETNKWGKIDMNKSW